MKTVLQNFFSFSSYKVKRRRVYNNKSSAVVLKIKHYDQYY